MLRLYVIARGRHSPSPDFKMASQRGAGGGGYYGGDQGGNWGYSGRKPSGVVDVQDPYEAMPPNDRSDGTYNTAAALLSTVLKMMTSDGPQAASSESGYPQKDWSLSQGYGYRRSNDSSELESGYSPGYGEPFGQRSHGPADHGYRSRSPLRLGPHGRGGSWQRHDSWQDRGRGYAKGQDFPQGAGWQPSGRGKRGKWAGGHRGGGGGGGMSYPHWTPGGRGYAGQTARPGYSNVSAQHSAPRGQVGKFEPRGQTDKQPPKSMAKVQGVAVPAGVPAAGGAGVAQGKASVLPTAQAGQQSLPAAAAAAKAPGIVLSKNQKQKLKRYATKPAVLTQNPPSSGAPPGDGASGAAKGHFGERPVASAVSEAGGDASKGPSGMADKPSASGVKQEPGVPMKRKLTHAEQPLAKKPKVDEHSQDIESSSVFGGLWSIKPKGLRRKGTKKPLYGCSLCQIRTNQPSFIKGHLESVYHRHSLGFLEEEFDKDVAKFLHKLIWRRVDSALKRLNEVKCVLGDSDEIFKQGRQCHERDTVPLDEALEMRIAVQCHACNMFMPYTSFMVSQHMKSAEHQNNKSLYVNERKTMVVSVAKSVLGNDNNSVLLKLFKEGKDPFNNPEYDDLFIISCQSKKPDALSVAGYENYKESAADDNAGAGEATAAEQPSAEQQQQQQPPPASTDAGGETAQIGAAQEDVSAGLWHDTLAQLSAGGQPDPAEGAVANGGPVCGADGPSADLAGPESEADDLGGVVVIDGDDDIFTGFGGESAAAAYGEGAAQAATEETSLVCAAQGHLQEGRYEEGQRPASAVETAVAVLRSESAAFFEDSFESEWGLVDAAATAPVAVGRAASGASRRSNMARRSGRGRGAAGRAKGP